MPENARSLALLLLALIALAHPAPAEGPYRNRDSKDPNDLSEGTYPIPYQKPTIAEIKEVLERVHGYLEANSPTQVVDGRTGKEITGLLGPQPGRADPGRRRRGVLPPRLHDGRHPLRDAAGPRGDRGRALRGVHAPAAPVHRRPPAVLPRGGGEGRSPGEGDLRGDPADGIPRRLRLDVRGPRQGASEGRRAGPEGRHRPLERLRRPPAVPARGRDARPAAPPARVAVGRRPLHGRPGARPDGCSHRRPGLVRRRGEAGPAVQRPPLGPAGALSTRTAST